MPNRKNAILQQRKDEKRRLRNSACKAELKTVRKKFDKVLADGIKEKVSEEYPSKKPGLNSDCFFKEP